MAAASREKTSRSLGIKLAVLGLIMACLVVALVGFGVGWWPIESPRSEHVEQKPKPDSKRPSSDSKSTQQQTTEHSAEEVQKIIENGGKNWSAPTTAPDIAFDGLSGGNRYWMWPAKDQAIQLNVSKPEKIAFSWQLRPGQKAIQPTELKALRVEINGRATGVKFGLLVPVAGIKAGSTEGTVEINPGPKLMKYRGDGEMLMYVRNLELGPVSNLLRVKLKITD